MAELILASTGKGNVEKNDCLFARGSTVRVSKDNCIMLNSPADGWTGYVSAIRDTELDIKFRFYGKGNNIESQYHFIEG